MQTYSESGLVYSLLTLLNYWRNMQRMNFFPISEKPKFAYRAITEKLPYSELVMNLET